jgi:hypothetical protein
VCTIYVTSRGEAESDKRLEMIMAHEMVHCYQGAVGVDIQGGGAPWMIEGFAAWAGQEVVGGVDFEKTDKWWHDYLTMPGKPLFSRSYDAIGFWANSWEHGRNLYDLFPGIMNRTNEDAFFFAVGLDQSPKELLDAWAAGIERDPSRGGIWDAKGVEITDDAYDVPVHTIGNDDGIELFTSARSTDLDLVNMESDFATIEVTDGAYGRIGLESGGDMHLEEAMNEEIWCTGGECECPEGTEREGEDFPEWRGHSALVALAGVEDTVAVDITGLSVDEVCGNKCLTGTWVSSTFTEGVDVLGMSGGSGVVVVIDEDGSFSVDFDEMEPLAASLGDLTQVSEVTGGADGHLTYESGKVMVDEYNRHATATLYQLQEGGQFGNDVDGTFEVPVGPDVYFFSGTHTFSCDDTSMTLTTDSELGETSVPFRKQSD